MKRRLEYLHHTSHVLPWCLSRQRKRTYWSKHIRMSSSHSHPSFANLSLSFLTLCLMSFMVSVRKMEDVGSLEDILLCGPCRAGKKEEWNRAGLWKPRRGATSRVILKYGSWKIKKTAPRKICQWNFLPQSRKLSTLKLNQENCIRGQDKQDSRHMQSTPWMLTASTGHRHSSTNLSNYIGNISQNATPKYKLNFILYTNCSLWA